MRQSLQEERSPRRLGRSATQVNGPRYDGAQPWSVTLYTSTATLDLIIQEHAANECVRDMVGTTQVKNQPRGCVEY